MKNRLLSALVIFTMFGAMALVALPAADGCEATVNAGYCGKGCKTKVNAGYCGNGCNADVNVGRCGDEAANVCGREPLGEACSALQGNGANDHWEPNCPHSSPHSHVYSFGGTVGARSDAVTGGQEGGFGSVDVFETNTVDCDGDGFPNDFDGDYETGVGGGFFGFGPWAHESTCNYGLTPHGSFVVVVDAVFGASVAFIIGADDTSGPAISVDPVDGRTVCHTDGTITPGDPTTNPTADADDCFTATYIGSGSTCGAGGDGGYWVFIHAVLVDESGGNPSVSNFPTVGSITA